MSNCSWTAIGEEGDESNSSSSREINEQTFAVVARDAQGSIIVIHLIC